MWSRRSLLTAALARIVFTASAWSRHTVIHHDSQTKTLNDYPHPGAP